MLSTRNHHFLTTYLRPEWRRVALLGVLLFIGVGLQLANPQIAKLFIDRAQGGEPFEHLVWIALVFLAIVGLTQAAIVAETYVAEDLGWRTTNTLRGDLTRQILELDGGFHGEHGAGELIERIDGDVAAIADFFARFVVQLLGSGVFVLGVLILPFGEDWRIGGLLSVCVAAAVVIMARGGGFVSVRSRQSRGVAANLTSFLEEHLGALPDLKSNGADDYALRGLLARLEASFRATHASVLAGSIFNAAVGVIFVLGACGALGLSATLYGASVITLGGVYAVFRYTSMLRQPLERLMRQMNSFQTAMGGVAQCRNCSPRRRGLRTGVASHCRSVL